MCDVVQRAILGSGLIVKGARLVVAVSGGADSLALLVALRALAKRRRWRLVVAHMDHGIRGAASRADALFVAALARRWRIPMRSGRCNVPLRARRRGRSLEAVAREVRYDFLACVAREAGADAVVTAHTADDQAETVLMNVCRGSGMTGLGGIPPVGSWRGIRVVRPLLGVGHAELTASLERCGVSWREDETNADTRFTRNRVRRQVIPLLTRIVNPSVRDALCRLATLCRDDAELLDTMAGQCLRRAALPDGSLSVAAVVRDAVAVRRRVARRWLVSRGVSAQALNYDCLARCEVLLKSRQGSATVPLDGGAIVRREYGLLRLLPGGVRESQGFCKRIKCPGKTVVVPPGLVVEAVLGNGIVRPSKARAGDMPAKASINAAKVRRRSLFVRAWRPGDRIKPLGMRGSRKVQDILTDDKVPRDRRNCVPVVECGGEIVWIPGYRIARGWEVPGEDAPAIQLGVARR
jgi:tRNA(Ile)-lysidine synthase